VSDTPNILFVLAAVILATRLLGEIAQRFGRPAVLGELVAGVLLGSSVLGVYDPHSPLLQAFAQLGVLVLLFQIGLSTDLRSLRRFAAPALMVASVGVLLPFVGGVALMRALGVDPVAALVAGAALTPTSVGISARVFNDLGRLQSPEGQVVLGAAIFDDVIGLVILSVISGVVAGGSVTWLGVGRTAGVAVGFIAVALVMGSVAIPPLFKAVERIRSTGGLGLIALAFALSLAWLAAASGSAMIIGAFAAGLILHPTPQRREIEVSVTALGHLFVPIFFAGVGAAVELRTLASPSVLLIGAALLAVGAAGKIAAGFSPWWFDGHKMLIGVGMLPRGEVELIIAQMALASGAISSGLFGALMLVVAATVLISPVIIERVARARPMGRNGRAGDGGIADLVAGTHHEARQTRPISRKHERE
jgi:Kef-type K+ transport system membrane component KefB